MRTANRVIRFICFGLPQNTDDRFSAVLFLFYESTPYRYKK
jgi:hypothetical protein